MATSKVNLQTAEYILLLQSFKEWLTVLNYSGFSIPGLTKTVKDFLLYQEGNDKSALGQMTATDAITFIEGLKIKTGERTGRPLSNGHINKQIQALNLFSKYISE